MDDLGRAVIEGCGAGRSRADCHSALLRVVGRHLSPDVCLVAAAETGQGDQVADPPGSGPTPTAAGGAPESDSVNGPGAADDWSVVEVIDREASWPDR